MTRIFTPPLAAALAAALLATPASAVHFDAVELDGDLIASGGLQTDWDEIVAGTVSPGDTVNGCDFVATTGLILDPAPQTIFTRGGSKDVNDIPNWHHKNGSVPDKNDMTHGVAAAFICGGDLQIYITGLRYSNDGDSNIGAWFTLQDVGPIGGGVFSGAHSDTDLFVTAGFSNGGTVVNVGIFGWDTATDSLTTIVDPDTNSADCDDLGPGDTECAIANSGETPIPVPPSWNYTPKSGAADTAPQNSAFELGINATAVVGDACFTGFVLETRSSTSATAQLKDFLSRDFAVCGIEVTLECDLFGDGISDTFDGFEYSLSGTVTSAFGEIASAEIWIDVDRDTALNGSLSNTSDDVLMTTAMNIPPSPGIAWSDDNEPFESGVNPITLEAYAVATLFGEQVVSDLSDLNAVAKCEAVTPITELAITKDCIVCLLETAGVVAAEVRATGLVTNNGDIPIENVIVTDSEAAGSVNLGTINPGDSARYYIDYVPSSVNSPDPDAAMFSDTAHAEGQDALFGNTVGTNPDATAECDLCIGSEGRTLEDVACGGDWPPAD